MVIATGAEKLSFVIPMWNERDLIAATVRAVRAAGDRLVADAEIKDYEVVIVDDASTDGSGALVDELAAEDDRLVVCHHAVNRKLGGSVRTGLAAATGDLILYTDADLPFDLGEVAKALRLMRVYDADIVAAYRFDRTAEGPRRYVYSHAYNWLVRLLLGVRVRDVNFAGKLLRREVIDAMELQSEGSFVDVELLARAERLGFHTVQFGVDYFPRHNSDSSLSSLAVIGVMVGEMRSITPSIRATRPLPDRRAVR